MSSEHSDEGVIDKVEYAQHRRQHGGEGAFEIRREMWRSEQVSLELEVPVILLNSRSSSIGCMLVYKPFQTELGRWPRRIVLDDVREWASPVAPDTKACAKMQMVDAHPYRPLRLGDAIQCAPLL
jgi:hypothetical protein